MEEHANILLLRRAYDAFGQGDMATLREVFAEDIVWHVPRRSLISGHHRGRDAVLGVFARAAELTGGSMRIV